MSIEKKYKKLTDLEHVLQRSGMYLGSIKMNTSNKYLIENDKMTSEEVSYIPGFIKLFDEIISNSVDESKREGSKLNTIKVNIENNKISIWDNGGIPVKIHNEYNEWIPEMIFSNMKAGSNFNDNEERIGAGTNGVGSTIVNIFSKEFSISTCDGSKLYTQVFTNNMNNRTDPIIKKSSKNHTQITYYPDYDRFNMDGLDDGHFNLIKKRVYDIAGTNPTLKIYFNNELISIKSFKDYVNLYVSDFCYETNQGWSVAIAKSDGSFNQVSFVNSVETYDGGTHVDSISIQIINKLREFFLKKHKVDIKPAEIKNHLFIFLDSTIINPIFSSQTKEKLVTELKDFGITYQISDKLIKDIIKSDIIESILDWIDKKRLAEENKLARELNKATNKIKVKKLIDARSKNERHKCSLAIFEGDSASGAFLNHSDPEYQGAFSIRGKFTNVLDISMSNLIKNDEVVRLMAAIGLKIGQKAIPENLRYGKIIIYTDADCLHSDTFVKTKRGLIKISQLSYDDEVLTHTNKYRKIKNIIETKKDNYLIIEVNGEKIKCSENHKWIVVRNNEIVEILAKDILITDYFIINNDAKNIINNEKYNIDYNSKKLISPIRITNMRSNMMESFYDIEVEEDNTFYITNNINNDELLLTHNCDGSHISSLLINFFYKFWKELFDYGMIYKAETPIIVARSKSTVNNFYKLEDYREWEKNNDTKKWDISYKKGLSALKDDEYENIITNPYLVKIVLDADSDNSINTWFAKDDEFLEKRKNIIQFGI